MTDLLKDKTYMKKELRLSIKKISNTIALSSGKEVAMIISILKKCFGITHYCYIKSFNDGTHILLSNDSPWIEKFYLNFYENGVFHQNINTYQSGAMLWNSAYDQTTFQICREYFNIDHGITLIEKQKNYNEFFCFGSTKDNPQIINFYINNLNLLSQFNIFFKEKAEYLIKCANADRLKLPCHHLKSSNHPTDNYSLINLKQKCEYFLHATQSKQYRLTDIYSHICLTKRQLDCLNLITQGKSAKEVARILKISFRTVETHMENIKIKLGVKNKAGVIATSLKYNPHYKYLKFHCFE